MTTNKSSINVNELFTKAKNYSESNDLNQALFIYDEIISIKPDFIDAFLNRGVILCRLMRFLEGLKDFDLVIKLKPNYAIAFNNRGNALTELGRYDEAIESYDQAIKIDPNYADALTNFAIIKLLLGEYKEGWKLFEWRWKGPQKKDYRDFKKPLWLGSESIQDKTILVSAEQGLGDFIQFYRYCESLEKLGAKILIETPKEFFHLIKSQNKKNTIIKKGKTLPKFDFYCPIMSLPLAFKTTLKSIPLSVPYIKTNPDKSELWKLKLGTKKNLRIGIAWSGAKNYSADNIRSLRLEQFAPLFDLPFDFYSLHKEVRNIDKNFLSQSNNIYDYHKEIEDFSDTAALIIEMDIVISVDTSVAHLAGALDKPLWILLPYVADYRWMIDRIDSPWYSSATLFRQKEINNWDSVISSILRSLRTFI